MSESVAFCPQCRRDTSFVAAGGTRRCSLCGWQFQMSAPRALEGANDSSPAAVTMGVLGVVLRVFLILVTIVIVGVGVLFAGCALMMGGGHF